MRAHVGDRVTLRFPGGVERGGVVIETRPAGISRRYEYKVDLGSRVQPPYWWHEGYVQKEQGW